jgi:hypothetical protein
MKFHTRNTLRHKPFMAMALLAFVCGSFSGQAAAGGSAGWSRATAISPVNQPDPTRGSQLNDMAVNATGLTIAAWDQYNYTNSTATIGVNIQSGGSWGTPFTVSGTGGYSSTPRVAVGGDGTMAVSWTRPDPVTSQPQIQVAVRPAGTTVWTTTTLAVGSTGGVAITQFVPLVIDGNGNVTAVWSLWNGTIHVVQSAMKPAGGNWSTPVNVSTIEDGMYPALALNASGTVALAYAASAYTNVPGSCGATQGTCAFFALRSTPGGAWTTPVVVSETIPNTVGYVTNPVVGLDGNGLATVIYLGYGVEAVRESALNTWTAPLSVLRTTVSGATYQSPDLAVDANGNAVAVVSIFDPTINVDRASVWVTQGTPSGSWTPQLRLTNPSAPQDCYATRAAMSADGTLAIVGWIDHYNGVAQAATLTSGSWVTSTIGKGTALSAFQEVMGLRIGANTVGRAIWKNAQTGGTQTMASNYN